MIEIRPFASLGHANHGWLDARHHFSFANYYEPSRMGWGPLRVWNDDAIAAKSGFPPHPHRDMEIITYVREGAISHRDSLGNEGRTAAGDVQVMSAGTGITHAEFNQEDAETRLFQIWIEPREGGGQPRWDARPFPRDDRSGRWTVLASGYDNDNDALAIDADARIAGILLPKGESVSWSLAKGASAYLVPATGSLEVNGQTAATRDGVAVRDEDEIRLTALEDAEVLLVETG